MNCIKKPRKGSWDEWFLFHDAEHLLALIIANHDEMQMKGMEPGSSKWETYGGGQRKLYDMVADRWSHMTGQEKFQFPWTIGDVIETHVKFRKVPDSNKPELREKYLPKLGNNSHAGNTKGGE